MLYTIASGLQKDLFFCRLFLFPGVLMSKRPLPTLHVDGSLTEYIDKGGTLHQVAGLGGYLVVEGKIVNKFYKTLKDEPHLNHHEEYAVLEGLKWVKEMGFNNVKVKTDSMYSVSLFNNQKKSLCKIDKFFLLQFMILEFSFDWIELLHHSRTNDDLSHLLSRVYLNDLPKNIIKLHTEHKRKNSYNIVNDATILCEQYVKTFLHKNITKISHLMEAQKT